MERNEWEEIGGCKDIRQVLGNEFYLVESPLTKGCKKEYYLLQES